MVCLITSSEVKDKSESNKMNDRNHTTAEPMTDDGNEDDKLKLTRLAGGSLIDYPPLFSPDGELLLIIFKNLVRIYSTTTGERVRDLEGARSEIIGINYELRNNKIVTALTRSGEIVRWKWKSGAVEGKLKLPLRTFDIFSFHFVDLATDHATAFITYCTGPNRNTEWAVVDTINGEKINISGNLELCKSRALIEVDNVNFHYVAAIQDQHLIVQNYRTGWTKRWRNAKHVPFTILRVHPTEEMVATGDNYGRIFLWRNIFASGEPNTNLYHWHHTAVTSLAFTLSGTGFYSGGQESVLVQWNVDRPDMKNFVPRMHAIIVHIVVGDGNRKVAVCTADNGIQILDSQNNAKCMVQGFTYVYNDKTDSNKFPIGLKMNPRTNSLALNGRVGHIQFYSTYTRRLLYNIDIVMQNQLSMETNKILYNIRVVCLAFNKDWMATIEEWNDREHPAELRLKFWCFNKENQSYTLNTNVEQPHEDGVKAIEFSSPTETTNLLCATAGCDDYIKMWALEDSDNIYRTGKVWYCIGRTKYCDFTVNCINFSQDGSLLAAGFRDTLCIFKSQTLALKVALTAPAKYNGIVKDVMIELVKEGRNSEANKSETSEGKITSTEENRILEMFKNFFENNDEQLIQVVKTSEEETEKIKRPQGKLLKQPLSLSSDEKKRLFHSIHNMKDLNLFHKIDLYQKLGIYCKVPKESRQQIVKYVTKNILEKDLIEKNLDKDILRLSDRYRFKAKYRVYQYMNRKRRSEIDQKLVPVMNLLGLNDNSANNFKSPSNENKIYGNSICNGVTENDVGMKGLNDDESESRWLEPLPVFASMNHVLFAAGEHAHLIVTCSEHRVVIWNILTLRFQAVLKLSTSHIVMDPVTSLFAVFTINNELYIFQPHAPMPIYHRVNVPELYGAVWVPKRYPKSQSLNLNWQASSTLYFLTKDQELMYLADEKEDDVGVETSFVNEAQDIARYSTFGTFAAKQHNAKLMQTSKYTSGIGVPGKAAVKSLIEMATHTMAPNHLLCADFIESMLQLQADHKNPKSSSENSTNPTNNQQLSNSSDNDDESDDEMMLKSTKRVDFNEYTKKSMKQNDVNKTKQIQQREKLKGVLNDEILIEF